MKKDLSFGTLAVQLGYTTEERVKECLSIQEKIRALGVQPKKLGEIMVDKGYLTEAQVKHIFRVQGLKGGHLQIKGYQILRQIGQGATGKIYLARQLSMDRLVAVKVLSPQLAQNESFVQRFLREARSVARLNHPNIVQGIDAGESDGVHYFVMEYIDGHSLNEIVKNRCPLPEKEALKIIIQITRALDHAYKNNLVHRDIKPSNVMINRAGVAKLCDLGIARLTIPEACRELKGISGTPLYISPEQIRLLPDVDIRSDIYSLGATFYFLILGEPPFSAETAQKVMTKHLTEEPIPPRKKNPQISPLVNNIILKMLAKKREERYQTPQALLVDLEMALNQLIKEEASAPEPYPLRHRLRLSRLRLLRSKRWYKR